MGIKAEELGCGLEIFSLKLLDTRMWVESLYLLQVLLAGVIEALATTGGTWGEYLF